jgi:hypothetical protein
MPLLCHCMVPAAGIECFEVAAEVEMGPASRLTGALHAVALTLMNSRVSQLDPLGLGGGILAVQ